MIHPKYIVLGCLAGLLTALLLVQGPALLEGLLAWFGRRTAADLALLRLAGLAVAVFCAGLAGVLAVHRQLRS